MKLTMNLKKTRNFYFHVPSKNEIFQESATLIVFKFFWVKQDFNCLLIGLKVLLRPPWGLRVVKQEILIH